MSGSVTAHILFSRDTEYHRVGEHPVIFCVVANQGDREGGPYMLFQALFVSDCGELVAYFP